VQHCELVGLADLDTGEEYVRKTIAGYTGLPGPPPALRRVSPCPRSAGTSAAGGAPADRGHG
ncbi:hypothetical protein, partial [Streptomyces sp. NPDC002547]